MIKNEISRKQPDQKHTKTFYHILYKEVKLFFEFSTATTLFSSLTQKSPPVFSGGGCVLFFFVLFFVRYSLSHGYPRRADRDGQAAVGGQVGFCVRLFQCVQDLFVRRVFVGAGDEGVPGA
ncbi:MAG: hypothetical protein IJV00_01985 [Clostridia bacterium]|nr:hypothetical protein [Clostridia bacterium]